MKDRLNFKQQKMNNLFPDRGGAEESTQKTAIDGKGTLIFADTRQQLSCNSIYHFQRARCGLSAAVVLMSGDSQVSSDYVGH